MTKKFLAFILITAMLCTMSSAVFAKSTYKMNGTPVSDSDIIFSDGFNRTANLNSNSVVNDYNTLQNGSGFSGASKPKENGSISYQQRAEGDNYLSFKANNILDSANGDQYYIYFTLAEASFADNEKYIMEYDLLINSASSFYVQSQDFCSRGKMYTVEPDSNGLISCDEVDGVKEIAAKNGEWAHILTVIDFETYNKDFAYATTFINGKFLQQYPMKSKAFDEQPEFRVYGIMKTAGCEFGIDNLVVRKARNDGEIIFDGDINSITPGVDNRIEKIPVATGEIDEEGNEVPVEFLMTRYYINESSSDKNVVYYLAKYGSDGELLSVAPYSETVVAYHTCRFRYTVTALSDVAKIKLMIWDPTGIKPISTVDVYERATE